MDEKPSEEAKPKVTRSRARHERRKRLRSARKAAEKHPPAATNETNVEADVSNDSESPVNRDDNEALSKSEAAEKHSPAATNETNGEADGSNDSKSPVNRNDNEALSKSEARKLRKSEARRLRKSKAKQKKQIQRLRKRSKTTESSENNANASTSSSKVSESLHRPILEDPFTFQVIRAVCVTIVEAYREKRLQRAGSDVIDLNSSAEKSDAPKTTVSARELLENRRNLNIIESSRASPRSPCKGVGALRDSHELIIRKDSSPHSERETVVTVSESEVKSNGRERVDASEEVSLTDSTKESCSIEVLKVCPTSESAPSIGKMIAQEKTREQVKADREAKKAAKAAAKGKPKVAKTAVIEKTVETPSVTISSKKIIDETKGDVVDGEIIAMTTKHVITESKIESELVPIGTEAKTEVKSKSVMRAERRAKQEAQRAAKQDQLAEKSNVKTKNAKAPAEVVKASPKPRCKTQQPTRMLNRVNVAENAHEVSLFKHLYHEREQALIKVPTVNSTIHPAIIRLGVQYANKVIVGSNARCVALLAAVKQLIEDFERPPQADFTRGLEASLQESSAYLHHCRPIAVSMQNALRHLKWQMTQLPATTSDEEAKTKLGNAIDTYIQEQILLADKAISITIQTKISNGDVILTYGYSSLICKILCDAYDAGRKFRVVVVDGRPWLEGREQLRRLAKHGLECSYVMINALSFIMPEVSKVFLGAHAILANGAVMSRVGTAQVALMAKAFNVPVLVACETHKTCERVQTDSIVYNEIANADELAQNLMGSSKKTSLINWRAKKSLNLLNLTYDVTPADLVTAVVTELAILPCTSVPVILRIKPSEI